MLWFAGEDIKQILVKTDSFKETIDSTFARISFDFYGEAIHMNSSEPL